MEECSKNTPFSKSGFLNKIPEHLPTRNSQILLFWLLILLENLEFFPQSIQFHENVEPTYAETSILLIHFVINIKNL